MYGQEFHRDLTQVYFSRHFRRILQVKLHLKTSAFVLSFIPYKKFEIIRHLNHIDCLFTHIFKLSFLNNKNIFLVFTNMFFKE